MRPEHPVPSNERPPDVGWQVASGGFFKALGIPLLAGRYFDERDRPDGPPVAIISEAIQRRFFAPGENPIGKTVGQGPGTAEIVGVVGNIRRTGLRDEFRADMYHPFERNYGAQITLFVSTATNPARIATDVRAAVRNAEPSVAFENSRTLTSIAAASEGSTRLLLWLLATFAGTALALAAVGVYGVMSYVVRQRTREFGTRLALGATRRDILWLVFRYGGAIAVIGTAIGIGVSFAAARTLQSVLFGISTTDASTLAIAGATVVVTGLVACYIPARRAIAVDPSRALADE